MSQSVMGRRREAFLTFSGCAALLVGVFALSAPSTLIEHVKHADASAAANVMARTAGVVIAGLGALSLMVRRHDDSPTLRSVLAINLVVQLALLPIDPCAFGSGTFRTLGSFVPNTALHVLLSLGFAYFLCQKSGKGNRAPA